MAGSIAEACEWMETACRIWDLGYDQQNRWAVYDGGECDCSSLVITALRESGFDTGDASYTGDMSDELTARGWRRLPADIDGCQPGDILLNDERHVCMVIDGHGWDATIAQASIDERGQAAGGAPGDQTGRETNVRDVYEYWAGWDCILRWGGAEGGGRLGVTGHLKGDDIREWQRQMRTPVDGVVSGQSERLRGAYPRLESVTFEGGGSQLMVAVQKRVGVRPQTGVIGGGTVAMVQGYLILLGYDLSGALAGVLDEVTAKAIQNSLNKREWA